MEKGVDIIVEAPTRSGGDFLPPVDNTYDLGSAAFSWKNAHFQTAIYATSVVGNWSPSVTGTYTLGTASLGWLGIFLDAASGADADIDIIKLLVTGTPKLWWDESGDAFALSHGLILADAKDIEIGAAGAIKSGATNTDTMLLKANDTTFITFTTAATDVCTLEAVTLKGTLLADGTVTMPALTLGGAISCGDQAMTGVGDMTFTSGSYLKSGGTNTNTLLIAANDTTFITLTTAATDVCTIAAPTMSGTWLASGTVTMPAMTFGGLITVGEVGIKLDTGIGTDQNYSGIVVAGVLGMTVVKGEICMLQSDEKWDKAQANSEAAGYGMLGICLVGGDDTGATTMLLYGTYRDDTAHEYTSGGQPLYLSDTSAGDFIATKPDTTNDIVRILAYVLYDKETVFFNPDGAYVTVA